MGDAKAGDDADRAVEFEYQVQKWLGSLYSLGFSNTEALAGAIGKLAAGDISVVTEGGIGNLIAMSAQQSGQSLADMLADGLDANKTNQLMESMVRYLSQLYAETRDSNVLAQQFAGVYGLSASDLKAAHNLNVEAVAEKTESTNSLLRQLENMSNTMFLRTSAGDMFQNFLGNLKYTMSAGLGNDPVLSATMEIAEMLQEFAGGIEIPFININGFGFQLNSSVANLMKIAAMSGSVLGGLGKLISSVGSGGGISGSGMLKAWGVDLIGIEQKQQVTSTGQNLGEGVKTQGGDTTSESGTIGNESSEDVKNKTTSDASEDPEKQIADAKEEQAYIKLVQVDEHVMLIHQLFQEVVAGSKKLHVQLTTGDLPTAWTAQKW
jgi:hypothetical protein